MVWLDEVARSSTIALLAIMAVVMTRDFRRVPLAGAAIALFPDDRGPPCADVAGLCGQTRLDFVLQVAALAAPGAFMFFSRALFDEDARFSGAMRQLSEAWSQPACCAVPSSRCWCRLVLRRQSVARRIGACPRGSADFQQTSSNLAAACAPSLSSRPVSRFPYRSWCRASARRRAAPSLD